MDYLQVLLGNLSITIAIPHHFAVSQAVFQVERMAILECSARQCCLAILAMQLEGKIKPLESVDFVTQAIAVITAAVVVAASDVVEVSSQDQGNAT